jgi:amidase
MSVTTTGLWRMSAMDLAEAIRSRQTSSQEVIEAHLRRIETVNPGEQTRPLMEAREQT